MTQDAIWDHFQTKGLIHFDEGAPRFEFLVRSLRPNDRVLNVGVGSGALEQIALQKGVDVWSLDPSERTIQALRERLGVGERAQVGYCQSAPFPSEHFDAVIMTEVLEHLEEDIREGSLKEVHRMLRPGGYLMGTVPAREQLELSEVVCPHCSEHFHRWGHQASFDVQAIRALLGRYFSIDSVHELFFNEWDSARWGRRLTGLLKKFLSWRGIGTYGLGRNIYFRVRK